MKVVVFSKKPPAQLQATLNVLSFQVERLYTRQKLDKCPKNNCSSMYIGLAKACSGLSSLRQSLLFVLNRVNCASITHICTIMLLSQNFHNANFLVSQISQNSQELTFELYHCGRSYYRELSGCYYNLQYPNKKDSS